MGGDDYKLVPMWIDNKEVKSDTLFDVVHSVNGKVGCAYGATPELALRAVESSHRAFQSWKATNPWKRRKLFSRLAQLLQERRSEIADILRQETPVDDFIVENINIGLSISLLEELAARTVQANSGVSPQSEDDDIMALVVREPLGVQLAIAPWNASLFLGLRAVATPIACGNTTVLKASEITPLVHHWIGVLFADAGFPPGVLNVIQHRREDAPEIVNTFLKDRRVAKVNFTGSTSVGQLIASKAAQFCKPVLLELGGKASQIVLQDADIDRAVQAAAIGAFTHHGQVCMSTEKVIIHESIYQDFMTKLQHAIKSVQACTGASLSHVDEIVHMMNEAISQGAKLVGGKLQREHAQVQPLILTDVTPAMKIWNTETFGPVLIAVPFRSIQDAIKLVNDCHYGLTASIFTSNIPCAMAIARQIESGAVHINSMTIHDDVQLPHGGVKASGWGRFGVPWGFDEFTYLKTVTITDAHFSYSFESEIIS